MADLPNDFIGLRKFKLQIREIDKPIRVVTTRGDVEALGTWLPEGTNFVIFPSSSSEGEVSSEETSGDLPRPERSGKRT